MAEQNGKDEVIDRLDDILSVVSELRDVIVELNDRVAELELTNNTGFGSTYGEN